MRMILELLSPKTGALVRGGGGGNGGGGTTPLFGGKFYTFEFI